VVSCGFLQLKVTTQTLSCVVFLCYVVSCRVDGIMLWFLEEEYDSVSCLVLSSLTLSFFVFSQSNAFYLCLILSTQKNLRRLQGATGEVFTGTMLKINAQSKMIFSLPPLTLILFYL
jgi:hypothetical protein